MEAAVVPGPESANAPLPPPGSFRRVVRRNLGQLAHCFEQGRTQNPELHGQVLLHVVVQPDGAVASASVASTTLPLPTVAQCMAGSFRRWQFPAPRGAQRVFLAVPLVLLQFEVRVRRGWRNGPYGSTYGPL